MLDGFNPRMRSMFFARRRTVAGLLAAALTIGPATWAFFFEPAPEQEEKKEEDPQIVDFAVEEEPAEPEPEPPPPPPPTAKVKVVKNPKPRPSQEIVDLDKKQTEAADESDKDKVIEVGADEKFQAGGTGTKPVTKEPKKDAPPPKPAPPKPKAEKAPIDPTKPIDRPVNAKAPEPEPGNAQPEYPKELRDKGVTGRYTLKVHVHRDGTVRGAKILAKKNTATTEEEQKQADALFMKAIIAAVKTWKYKPSTLDGEPITVWHQVTIPFNLTAG